MNVKKVHEYFGVNSTISESQILIFAKAESGLLHKDTLILHGGEPEISTQ